MKATDPAASRAATALRRGAEGQSRVSDTLFGTGPAELSFTLPGGPEVRRHTDGCLAQAQQRPYGDQERWFRASTTVDNLRSRAPAGERAASLELRAHAVRTVRGGSPHP
jgi:hypothetical protein